MSEWRQLTTQELGDPEYMESYLDEMRQSVDALAAELATVKAELDAYRSDGVTEELLRRRDGFLKVGKGCALVRAEAIEELTKERDHWKAEAVWLAHQLSDERVSQWADVYDVTMADEQVQRQVKDDPCYQRAQAVLKEAGDEGYER